MTDTEKTTADHKENLENVKKLLQDCEDIEIYENLKEEIRANKLFHKDVISKKNKEIEELRQALKKADEACPYCSATNGNFTYVSRLTCSKCKSRIIYIDNYFVRS